jgi:hypothetical protein
MDEATPTVVCVLELSLACGTPTGIPLDEFGERRCDPKGRLGRGPYKVFPGNDGIDERIRLIGPMCECASDATARDGESVVVVAFDEFAPEPDGWTVSIDPVDGRPRRRRLAQDPRVCLASWTRR